MHSSASVDNNPFFNVADIERQIGEEGLESLWREVREQWTLDMLTMVQEQELIRQDTVRNPSKINRKLDCYPDIYTHPLFENFIAVDNGWDANWKKDPDKLRFVKKKYPVILAAVEKPMDRVGWSRAQERGMTKSECRNPKGGKLVDRFGGAL